MKIEKLTDNKIRIIIDIDELSDKNIDINSLIKNTLYILDIKCIFNCTIFNS